MSNSTNTTESKMGNGIIAKAKINGFTKYLCTDGKWHGLLGDPMVFSDRSEMVEAMGLSLSADEISAIMRCDDWTAQDALEAQEMADAIA
jgi:hypothetical protein